MIAAPAPPKPRPLLPASYFTTIGPTEHDFLIFDIKNGKPTVMLQPKGTDVFMKLGVQAPNAVRSYIYPESGNYIVLTTVRKEVAIFAYFSVSYRIWLQESVVIMHSTPQLRIDTEVTGRLTDNFPLVMVTRTRYPLPDKAYVAAEYSFIMKFNPNDSNVFKYWTAPNDATYALGEGVYNIRLLQNINTPWYNNSFILDVAKRIAGTTPAIDVNAPAIIYGDDEPPSVKKQTSNWKILLFIFLVVAVVWVAIRYTSAGESFRRAAGSLR